MQPLARQLKTLGLETSFKRPHLRRGGWGAHSVGWACAGVRLGQGWVLPTAPCNVLGAGTGTCRVFPVAIGLAGSRSSQRCPDLASCPCLAAGLQHPRVSPCQASVGLLQPPAKLTKRRRSWAVHGPIPSSGCTGSNSQLGGGAVRIPVCSVAASAPTAPTRGVCTVLRSRQLCREPGQSAP